MLIDTYFAVMAMHSGGSVTQLAADPINYSPTAPPGSSKASTIVSWIGWAAMIAAILRLIVLGGTIGWERSHGGVGDSESGGKAMKTLFGCLFIGMAGGLVGALV